MTLRHYGGYVTIDWSSEDPEIEPLLWCLSFAICDEFPFDYFLPGILAGEDSAPSGGDPGWVMYPEYLPDGRRVYHAWSNPDMSYLDPCEGQYDESTVKRLVRRTLENFRAAHPERCAEIDAVESKYRL